MNRLLKVLFFALVVKPVAFVILGLNIRGRGNLPTDGPAVIIANHNSHLDTIVLMSLYPLSKLDQVRPVAAADYFMEKGGLRAWFSQKIMGIIPLDRSGSKAREDLFSDCKEALDQGQILILFPEGSRGEPEQMSELKKGVYYLIQDRPQTQVTPVMLHGLGRALPKGEALFVPFNCDVVIGNELQMDLSADEFVAEATATFSELSEYCLTVERN